MADEEVIDLRAKREELESLRREALSYGYALEGEHLLELRLAVDRMRGERLGKPGCYRRNYGVVAPQCQICDLRLECSNGIEAPKVPAAELEVVPCRQCDTGLLRVELLDEATGDIRDYACSSTGCTNTLLRQSQWRTTPPASIYELPIEQDIPDPGVEPASGRKTQAKVLARRAAMAAKRAEKSERPPARKPIPIEELDRQILDAIRRQGGMIPSMVEIHRNIDNCGRPRLRHRLQFLIHAGILTLEGRVYRLGEETQ